MTDPMAFDLSFSYCDFEVSNEFSTVQSWIWDAKWGDLALGDISGASGPLGDQWPRPTDERDVLQTSDDHHSSGTATQSTTSPDTATEPSLDYFRSYKVPDQTRKRNSLGPQTEKSIVRARECT